MTTPGTSPSPSDRTMTRSEEHLHVATQWRVSGRVRLQKFVTTEMVTIEVPVRREEIRLVHEPAGDADLGQDDGYRQDPVDGSRGEHVFVLHEERPVVTMAVVPVERVRAVVTTVTQDETVSRDVRAERIDVEHDGVEHDGSVGRS